MHLTEKFLAGKLPKWTYDLWEQQTGIQSWGEAITAYERHKETSVIWLRVAGVFLVLFLAGPVLSICFEGFPGLLRPSLWVCVGLTALFALITCIMWGEYQSRAEKAIGVMELERIGGFINDLSEVSSSEFGHHLMPLSRRDIGTLAERRLIDLIRSAFPRDSIGIDLGQKTDSYLRFYSTCRGLRLVGPNLEDYLREAASLQ